jgi:nicotinate phosphoribosyltransferase
MSGYPSGRLSGLLTDLYELTMAAGYVQKHFKAHATFELFVRHLPPRRNYLVAAGLEQALHFLENVHFSSEDNSYLRSLPLFRYVGVGFFEFLARFRFTGDVWALPEGTIFFPGEPLLRVTAPIAEAQLVETSLLSIVHLQTLIASKAARVTTAAGGRPVIEFGSRRAHGVEAGVLAARAAFIGGCEGTSNTFAGSVFGIPVYGTQAHSWVMAHEDESKAFSNFLDVFPEQSTLLVDTYDVRAAIDKIIARGRKPCAIRLDSGDVLADSRWARERLDASGWNDVQIFVSGDLDEDRIEVLLRDGACIDSFGVGTALSTSADAPFVGVIYKLVEVETDGQVRSTAKFSEEKKTYPGRKQVFRFSGKDGTYSSDVIGLERESMPGAETLLVPVMRQGRRFEASQQDSITAAKSARERFLTSRLRLPFHLLALRQSSQPFPVHYSARLEELCDQIRQTFVKPTSVGSSQRRTISPATILWEVDVQNDFMLPGGKLYVAGAEKIIPNINRLVDACRKGLVFLVSSADAHSPDAREFSQWPPHCLKATPGAELIPAARALDHLVIPNQSGFPVPQDLTVYQQVILEKNTLDVFDNPNADVLLGQLSPAGLPAFDPDVEFVVFGVVTEYCIRLTVDALLRRGRRVAVVTDAVQSLVSAKGAQILKELQSRGARLLTTEQVVAAVGHYHFGLSPREAPSLQRKLA